MRNDVIASGFVEFKATMVRGAIVIEIDSTQRAMVMIYELERAGVINQLFGFGFFRKSFFEHARQKLSIRFAVFFETKLDTVVNYRVYDLVFPFFELYVVQKLKIDIQARIMRQSFAGVSVDDQSVVVSCRDSVFTREVVITELIEFQTANSLFKR